MASPYIHPERIKQINEEPVRERGDYVLYWMQASQRTELNHALEYAIGTANEHQLPLLVGYGLMDDYPGANLRHYQFLVEGLADVHDALHERKIPFVVKHGNPSAVALELSKNAVQVICDRGYLRHQKDWRKSVADEAGCRVVQVETDVVVPVEVASDKREYAARTIRPKIHRRQDEFLEDLRATRLKRDSLRLGIEGDFTINDIEGTLNSLKLDRSVKPVADVVGGTSEATKRLARFVKERFENYDANRPKPESESVSHMAKYLHFGQISPVAIAHAIRSAKGVKSEDKDSYLEELIVRRELAMNFVNYEPNYDNYECLPDWALKTLKKHSSDSREHTYTRSQLEKAETHDEYWNAAMRSMTQTGYLHNHLRMYWGKKILEWGDTPEEAFGNALWLNNTYFIDGRDPNSFANIAWVFGLHDRPWKERDIFGTVRYMAASGLKRKCDIEAFVRRYPPG